MLINLLLVFIRGLDVPKFSFKANPINKAKQCTDYRHP